MNERKRTTRKIRRKGEGEFEVAEEKRKKESKTGKIRDT